MVDVSYPVSYTVICDLHMTLYQYTAEHYGKFLTDEALENKRRELCLRPQEATLFNWDASTNINRLIASAFASNPGEQKKKFILFAIKEIEIGHPRFGVLRETYVRVLTQNPRDESTMPAQQQFWVKKDWIEPLDMYPTYESEICSRLLKKIK